jgi:LmbE family N-acetylglucosaminyl deacetylase
MSDDTGHDQPASAPAMLVIAPDSAEGQSIPVHDWLVLGEITTQVPCGEFFGVRDEALKAHATQVDPEGFWFRCPLDVQQAAWPTEDYHLARSVVDSELPEDDLFAGVRESVSL